MNHNQQKEGVGPGGDICPQRAAGAHPRMRVLRRVQGGCKICTAGIASYLEDSKHVTPRRKRLKGPSLEGHCLPRHTPRGGPPARTFESLSNKKKYLSRFYYYHPGVGSPPRSRLEALGSGVWPDCRLARLDNRRRKKYTFCPTNSGSAAQHRSAGRQRERWSPNAVIQRASILRGQ